MDAEVTVDANVSSVTPAEKSLSKRVMKAGAWLLGGYGGMQAIRLASNLILTRLLFEEAFGMMQLASVFMVGLHLFSDIGIGPSIVQSAHGDDPGFLDTAFTIQVLRGTTLFVIGVLLAYPFSLYYGDPRLFPLVVGANATSLISAFQSTKLFTASRHLAQRKLTLLDLGTQFLGLVATVGFVALTRSVYALLVGGLTVDLVKTVVSHVWLPGPRNRFRIVRAHIHGMIQFGRWIFISTVITFLITQADRLVFGKLVPLAVLGVYGIAVNIASIAPQTLSTITDRLLFPLFSRVRNEGGDLREIFEVGRRRLLVLGGFCLAGFIGGGQVAIDLLYDDRYLGAGWITQVLSVGSWFVILESVNGQALLALGESRWIAATGAGKLIGIAILVPIGYALGGFVGAVIGYSAAELGRYALSSWGIARHGLLALGDDLKLSLQLAVGAAVGYGAAYATARFVSTRPAVEALAVFLGVLLVYAPALRGLAKSLLEIRARTLTTESVGSP